MSKTITEMSKVWFKFSKTLKNGDKTKFIWEPLPEHRFEDFVDFKIKYFVPNEITHIVSGIPKSPEAMKEYRHIVARKYKEPSYYTSILCQDNENRDIVAFNSVKLYRRGEYYTDVEPGTTPELKRFFQVLHTWNKLCPVPDILIKYGIDKYFDDAFLAVHPDYRGYQIGTEASIQRRYMCKAYGITLTGAWMTSIATQKISKSDGWETIYEISSKELEKILGFEFEKAPEKFCYKVLRL